MINEIFKFAQRRHKGFRVILTTSFLRIAITRRVGNNVFSAESVIAISRLADVIFWRTVVADELRKLRKDLRLSFVSSIHIVLPRQTINRRRTSHDTRYDCQTVAGVTLAR